MIDLRRLRSFVTVADELHFGRAAERLHISQPSLSQQIRTLEEDLGARLLDRDRRSVMLTAAGARLLEEGRALLWRIDELGAAVGRVARGEEGRLSVGFVGPAMEGTLPSALRRFRRRHARVQLTLWHRGTDAQIAALRAGEQDVGLLRPYQHDLADLETRRIDRQRYVLALPGKHALLPRRRVRLAQLHTEPLILFPRSTHPALYDVMLGTCAEAGYVPAVRHEASTKAMALAMVRAGVGVALVPEGQAAPGDRSNLRSVHDALPDVDILAAWRKDREEGPIRFFVEALTPAAGRRGARKAPAA
ncbi:LysR family transcriptional regulator [bacterium]|nr:LysR family transcriptional regulator [bacterium]